MNKKLSYDYNPELRKHAAEQRALKNRHEELLWNELRKRRFKNLLFNRQKIIGNYIVDFFCFEYKLIIEIDGGSHNQKQEYDRRRDKYLKSLGLNIIHISTEDIDRDFIGVMKWLEGHEVFGCQTHLSESTRFKIPPNPPLKRGESITEGEQL